MRGKAYLKIIVAMLIWGTLGIFTRFIGISSGEMVLFRVVIGGFSLLLVYLFSKHHSSGKAIRRAAPLLLLSGVVMGFNWLFLFEAYRYTAVSIATVAYYCSPVIVMLLSPLFFKERIAPLRVMGILCCIIGLVLISGTISGGASTMKGFGFGLIAAALYACVTMLNKCVKGVLGIEITLVQLLGAFIVMLPYCLIKGGGVIALPQSLQGAVCLVILGAVHTGLALYLYFSSLQTLSAQSAALCSYIDPGSALVFSAVFLDEKLTFVQIIAAVLILGGALFGELFSPNSARKRRG
ncbi:MAG: EamA family transporter [Oscillospiraceae bacterium]|nr:EamA family transporter [Oscillospiraceae bacterium]